MKTIFLLLIISISAFAQQQEDTSREALIEKMIKEGQKIDQQMYEMLKNLLIENGSSERFLESDFDELIKQFEGRFDSPNKGIIAETWSETDLERILILTVKSIKETPLDINIANGQISISGKMTVEEQVKDNSGNIIQTSKSVSQFTRAFPLPDDVDANKVKIDSNEKENQILIKLPKIKIKKVKDSKETVPVSPEEPVI